MSAHAQALPRVLVVSLGGTITMTSSGEGGIRPTLSAEQLLAAEPRLARVAELEAITPMTLPSPSLSLQQVCQVAALLRERLGAPDAPRGAVVVQGTDTIEDTAFLLDLLATESGSPVVVTGAMRGPQAPGADGPANLMAAVTVAADPRMRGLGAVVVLNDEIHAARWVQKAHTTLPSAFESPGTGRIGVVAEGRVQLFARPERLVLPQAGAAALSGQSPLAAVAQVALGLGEDGRMLAHLPGLGYAGAVIEGMGAGHVPAGCVEAIEQLAGRMPVVLCTRVRAGRVFTGTYGFAGSEMDLLARGVIAGGHASAGKARLLLALLVSAGADRMAIAQVFAQLA